MSVYLLLRKQHQSTCAPGYTSNETHVGSWALEPYDN
jgi:hypothetical protein